MRLSMRTLCLWLAVLMLAGYATPVLAWQVPTHQDLFLLSLQQLVQDRQMEIDLHGGNVTVWARILGDTAHYFTANADVMLQAISDTDLAPFSFNTPTLVTYHGWDKETNKGWLGTCGAYCLVPGLQDDALNAWGNGDERDYIRNIGALLHITQDMCVPHHCHPRDDRLFMDGHAAFEAWANDHKDLASLQPSGLYSVRSHKRDDLAAVSPQEYVLQSWELSQGDMVYVDSNNLEAEANYPVVVTRRMNDAIRVGAGLLVRYYRAVHNITINGQSVWLFDVKTE